MGEVVSALEFGRVDLALHGFSLKGTYREHGAGQPTAAIAYDKKLARR
jgi:hypothetical protein